MRTLASLFVFAAISTAADKNELPAAWHGRWKGTLELPKGDPVAMELLIEPIKDSRRLSWQITYGEGDKATVRKYELVPDDFVAGRFQLDEKNGIILEMKLHKGVIHSQFAINDKLLAGRYELRDGKIHFEITSSGKPVETGKEPTVVKVYPVTSVQTAILSKSK